MALPGLSTLMARFGRELTSNASLTWYNTNLSTALARAVPAIRTLVINDPVTYPVNAALPSRDTDSCLRLWLGTRYGYI